MKIKSLLDSVDTEEFLEQFLSVVEKQTTCSDVGEACEVRFTSFGNCCVKCGLLPKFWEESDGK